MYQIPSLVLFFYYSLDNFCWQQNNPLPLISICCSLLLYLDGEVMSSQWMVPQLRPPPQTFLSYNKPQPACLYHYIPSMLYNHFWRGRDGGACSGATIQPSEVGQVQPNASSHLTCDPQYVLLTRWTVVMDKDGRVTWLLKKLRSKMTKLVSEWVSKPVNCWWGLFICPPRNPSQSFAKMLPVPSHPIPCTLPKQQRHHDHCIQWQWVRNSLVATHS